MQCAFSEFMKLFSALVSAWALDLACGGKAQPTSGAFAKMYVNYVTGIIFAQMEKTH